MAPQALVGFPPLGKQSAQAGEQLRGGNSNAAQERAAVVRAWRPAGTRALVLKLSGVPLEAEHKRLALIETVERLEQGSPGLLRKPPTMRRQP